MARRPRLCIPHIPLHIVQRGNNKQDCFFNDEDRAFYIHKLQTACELYEVKVHAFVLMTNHVHLLLTPSSEVGISKVMQTLGSEYVRYFNRKYARTGTLWEGRFKSSMVQSSRYMLAVYRYIELNPVRAGIVKHPADYFWCSYHHNAGIREIKLVSPHPEYLNLGTTSTRRINNYKILVASGLDKNSLQNIRSCLHKSKVYGDNEFKEEMQHNISCRVEPLDHGGDRRSENFQVL